MSAKIPEILKTDLPPTLWGKVLGATPVVMTVVATMLAGLASSEMTRAQYDRSLAAQQQSKAGDQWNFFQAKKLRSALQHNTLDVLANTAEVHPLDTEALIKLNPALDSAGGRETANLVQKGALPPLPPGPALDPAVKAAIEAIAGDEPETTVAAKVAQVNETNLAGALRDAQDQVRALDALLKPVNQAVDQAEKNLAGDSSAASQSIRRDFTAARLRYASLRYDAEARLNQAIANVYEIQVRKNNASAERHHLRSQRFFYGMLAAQAAVIIATFAIAARKRNLLWSIAALAGLGAVSFAVYIYLFL